MKLLLVSLLSLSSVFANVADVRCDINRPIVVQGTFGNIAFNQAELDFTNLDKENLNFATLIMQDRFGSAYEVFNRLWSTNSRCISGDLCVSTEFSSLRGLSFSFPEEVFTNNFHNFTMRVRSNQTNRTYFASCNSTKR